MKKKLIIGVTPRLTTTENVSKQFVNENYIKAMNNYDFIPVVLPLYNDDIEAFLDKCDGFLITGGDDITPKYFNQENQGSEGCNEDLDILDKMVIEYACKTKKPMLGICRGHQAINVFLGGDLIQDIGQSHSHGVHHHVTTFENRLITFPKDMIVNSYHHQVLGRLADNLIEIARSDEGYNEAFIHSTLPIISFQWHPEKEPDVESSVNIFSTFKKMFK